MEGAPALTDPGVCQMDPAVRDDVARCKHVYPVRADGTASASWKLEYPNTEQSELGPIWPEYDPTATAANNKPIYNSYAVKLPEISPIMNTTDPSKWDFEFLGWCADGLQTNGECNSGVPISADTQLSFAADADEDDRTWYAQWRIQKPTLTTTETEASGTGIPGATVTVYADQGKSTKLCESPVAPDGTWSCAYAAGDQRNPGDTVYAAQTKPHVLPCCVVQADVPSAAAPVKISKAALGNHGTTFDPGRGVTVLAGAEFELYTSDGTSCTNDPSALITATDTQPTYALTNGQSYCLYEAKAPGGFELLVKPILFTFRGKPACAETPPATCTDPAGDAFATVVEGGANSVKFTNFVTGNPWFSNDMEIVVVDTSAVPMPSVGGIGYWSWVVLGIALSVIGGGALIWSRRREATAN